jgi:hypothetical protein
MKLTGQPHLGVLVLVLLNTGILTLLLRPLLLSGPLPLLLSILFILGVHTWNTPFSYWIPHRHARSPRGRKKAWAAVIVVGRTWHALTDVIEALVLWFESRLSFEIWLPTLDDFRTLASGFMDMPEITLA